MKPEVKKMYETGDMDNRVYDMTFEPIFDIHERWDITETDAEMFLEEVGYFDAHGI